MVVAFSILYLSLLEGKLRIKTEKKQHQILMLKYKEILFTE